MKKTRIVLVAQWDGWCTACAVERPLALTRSGRLGLRTWLAVPLAEPRPLTLTCRLCGDSAVVPSEQDDPPVLVELDDEPAPVETAALLVPAAEAELPPPSALVPVLAEHPRAAAAALPPVALPPVALAPVTPAPVTGPGLPVVVAPAPAAQPRAATGPGLDQARRRLGAALSALLAERTAQAAQVGRVTLTPSVLPHVPVVAAPALPLQRSAADADLATLQLLADGLDLLSSSRA